MPRLPGLGFPFPWTLWLAIPTVSTQPVTPCTSFFETELKIRSVPASLLFARGARLLPTPLLLSQPFCTTDGPAWGDLCLSPANAGCLTVGLAPTWPQRSPLLASSLPGPRGSCGPCGALGRMVVTPTRVIVPPTQKRRWNRRALVCLLHEQHGWSTVAGVWWSLGDSHHPHHHCRGDHLHP